MKQYPFHNSPSIGNKSFNLSLGEWSSPSYPVRICVVLFFLVASGCSNSNRPTTIPVEGKITFAGGEPEYAGALFFAPLKVAEGYPKRPGRALFDLDGKFEVTSFEDGDGLVPGTYRVRVESWKKPPGMGGAGVSYVPDGFETDDLVVSKDEKSFRFDLDVE